MKTKNILALAVLLGMSVVAMSQSVVASVCADGGGVGGTMSLTVGEVVYQFGESDDYCLTGGVQGSYTVYASEGIAGIEPLPFEVQVFPNPVTDRLTVRVSDGEATLRCQLYSLGGALLATQPLAGGETEVAMGRYATGTYLLRCVDADGRQQNFKVVKR
mgnify:CR=1 FL=1